MRRYGTAAFSALCLTLMILLSSCGNKLDDTSLLDLPAKGILGMTAQELADADPNLKDKSLHVTEKDMTDGSHRLKYVIVGDAFINGGNWVTTVHYYLVDGVLDKYEIEYRQSDYSEGDCKRRMEAITNYLDDLYGEASETYVVLGEYMVKGTAWSIADGVFDMSRQNG